MSPDPPREPINFPFTIPHLHLHLHLEIEIEIEIEIDQAQPWRTIYKMGSVLKNLK